MKSFALVLFVAQVVIFQSTYSQVLRSSQIALSGPIIGPALSSCGCSSPILPAPILPSCGCASPVLSAPVLSPVVSAPIVSSVVSPVVPSVANSLADTLSLLTVSSLLADTLPLSYPNVVSTVPVLGGIGGCGCGGYSYLF